MPMIAMPEKEPPPPQVIPDSGNKSDKEIIEKIQTDIAEEQYEDEDSLIEVTERLIPEEDDVFGERPVPQIKPIVQEEEEAPQPEQESSSEFKPTGKRAYKRKAPMSQKQKDHLARIRKIASEKRAKEREQKAQDKIKKEEEKEEARVKKAEERILAKQRKEQEQVNEPKPARAPTLDRPSVPQTGFTRDDMERAMFSAISSYETIRKREKEDKKKRQLAEAREEQMKRTLHQAINPDKPPDPWRSFFS